MNRMKSVELPTTGVEDPVTLGDYVLAWGINLVKNCWVDGKYVSTSWAHLKSGTNHAPLEFGYLIFK